jgi:hypothetical protein
MSRMTVLRPGHSPPHVTTAARTVAGSHAMRSKGPTRAKTRGSVARALAPPRESSCVSSTASPRATKLRLRGHGRASSGDGNVGAASPSPVISERCVTLKTSSAADDALPATAAGDPAGAAARGARASTAGARFGPLRSPA